VILLDLFKYLISKCAVIYKSQNKLNTRVCINFFIIVVGGNYTC